MGHCFNDLSVEPGNSSLVDLPIGRQFHRVNLLTSRILEALQHSLSLRMDEQNGFPASTRTSCSADAMHISFAVAWQVVVDHVTDSLHVQPSSGDVRGNHDIQLAGLKVLDNSFALSLSNVAVQSRSFVAASSQKVRQRFRRALQFDEDDDSVDRFGFQNATQCLFLLELPHHHESLTNCISCGRLLTDCDFCRISKMLLSNASNLIGHRCGEQSDLTFSRKLCQNPFHTFGEAHAKHFIGFVKYKAFQIAEVQ